MTLGMPVDFRALKLYDESMSPAWLYAEKQAVDILYHFEAYSDEDPTLSFEEAARVHGELQKLINKRDYWFDGYDSPRLQKRLLEKFKIEEEPYATLAKQNLGTLLKNIKALENPGLVAAIWNEVKGSPMAMLAVFYNPDAAELFSMFRRISGGGAQAIDFARSLISETVISLEFHESYSLPITGTTATPAEALSLKLAQISLNYNITADALRNDLTYKKCKRCIDIVQSSVAFEYFAEEAVQKQEGIGELTRAATQSSDNNIVGKALAALATFKDRRATDFLIDQLFYGSYNMRLSITKLLGWSRNKGYIAEKLREASESSDEYIRLAAKKAKEMLGVGTLSFKDNEAVLLYQAIQEVLPFLYQIDKGLRKETYTTEFFRFPMQFKWIADQAKGLMREEGEVTILSTGSSYGPEAYSLLFYMNSDFERDPAAWPDEYTSDGIKIFATDIDPIALAYARRGRFIHHPASLFADIKEPDEWIKKAGVNSADYFDISKDGQIYNVKPVWKKRIRFEELDVLNPWQFADLHGRPDIVMFNMIDGHLGDEGQIIAAEELSDFAAHFVTAVFRENLAPPVFNNKMELVKFMGALYLYRAYSAEPICGP